MTNSRVQSGDGTHADQPGAAGVAADAFVAHLVGVTLAVQLSLQEVRVTLALRKPMPRGQAVAEGHDQRARVLGYL